MTLNNSNYESTETPKSSAENEPYDRARNVRMSRRLPIRDCSKACSDECATEQSKAETFKHPIHMVFSGHPLHLSKRYAHLSRVSIPEETIPFNPNAPSLNISSIPTLYGWIAAALHL